MESDRELARQPDRVCPGDDLGAQRARLSAAKQRTNSAARRAAALTPRPLCATSATDERVMSVVTLALRLNPEERASHVRRACASDRQLYEEVTEAIDWEQRMGCFLRNPAISFQELVLPFQAGQIISERFEIIREIGQGGMGVVYEAFDRKRNQRIAIKSAKPGFCRLLSPELEGALKVRHPNICLVNEIHTAQTEYGEIDFLTMELLVGETLSARLAARGKLSIQEGSEIAAQLCKGLTEAHRIGVVHGDLKPDNVILCENADGGVRAVITDFGLSGGAVELGGLYGTPHYMAPELWVGEKVSRASDIHAFGVILHEMLAGPSSYDSSGNRVQAGKIPRAYLRLIEGCLSPDPEKRQRALDEALQVLQEDTGTLSRRRVLVTCLGTLCVAGGAWWKQDEIEDKLHPLPTKRFVALLAWPPTIDAQIKPLVTGIVDAIENELARAEASDRNLSVISSRNLSVDGSAAAQIRKVCDSLGANLLLAASAVSHKGQCRLRLTLRDAATNAVLRHREIICAIRDLTALMPKAVRTAAGLLNVHWDQSENRLNPSTGSVAAFTAFQTAEESAKQPNDDGLDAAIESYRKAIDADGKYAIAYAKLAIAYSRYYALHRDPGALELAQANAEKAIGIDPKLVDGYLALAYISEAQGIRDKALDEVNYALKLDPANSRTLLWKAQIYQRFNLWKEAEQAYLRLKRQRPNYWLAYQELGVLLNAQGRYQEAIQAFGVATLAAPGSALAFNNLGALYLKLGNFVEAEEKFRRSLKLKPNDLAYSNLAEAFRAQGKYADAVRCNREAVKLNPSDDQNWLGLGDSYEALRGQEKQARETYRRAASETERRLRTDPTDGSSWIRLALYRVKDRSSHEVLPLIRKADSYATTDVDSELTKARVFELSGRRKEALATLAACFKQGTTEFEVASIADFNALREDPEYLRILKMKVAQRKNI